MDPRNPYYRMAAELDPTPYTNPYSHVSMAMKYEYKLPSGEYASIGPRYAQAANMQQGDPLQNADNLVQDLWKVINWYIDGLQSPNAGQVQKTYNAETIEFLEYLLQIIKHYTQEENPYEHKPYN